MLVAVFAVIVVAVHQYVWVTGDLNREELEKDLLLARSVVLGLDRYMDARRYLIKALAAEASALGMRDNEGLTALLETARRREGSGLPGG